MTICGIIDCVPDESLNVQIDNGLVLGMSKLLTDDDDRRGSCFLDTSSILRLGFSLSTIIVVRRIWPAIIWSVEEMCS